MMEDKNIPVTSKTCKDFREEGPKNLKPQKKENAAEDQFFFSISFVFYKKEGKR